MKSIFNFLMILLVFFPFQRAHSTEGIRTGIIKGRLFDAETKHPLIGANIVILNSILGAASDLNGYFMIQDVPVGSYVLQFSYIGYKPLIKPDIIIRPQRTIYLEVELSISSLESVIVVVTEDYFSDKKEQPLLN